MSISARWLPPHAVLCAYLLVAAASLPAQVQPAGPGGGVVVVRSGDSAVDGRRIPVPSAARFDITYALPDGRIVSGGPRRVAVWYDSIEVEPVDGKPALHRRQVLLNPAGERLETIDNLMDPRTLAPIRTETRYGTGRASVRQYRGPHVTGSDPDSTVAAGERSVDLVLAEAPFDFFGGLYDLLPSALPLREGYTVRIPADNSGTAAGAELAWVTLTVAGQERLERGSRAAEDTWRVDTDLTPLGRFAFWISTERPHLVRMWYIGPRGGKQIWDLA